MVNYFVEHQFITFMENSISVIQNFFPKKCFSNFRAGVVLVVSTFVEFLTVALAKIWNYILACLFYVKYYTSYFIL